MSLRTLFQRKSTRPPPQPSTALLALRNAIDGVEAAVIRTEDARLSCLGLTFANVATIGAAHRCSAFEVTASAFALNAALDALNACKQNPPRPDEREHVKRCLSRTVALQFRMGEIFGRVAQIR